MGHNARRQCFDPEDHKGRSCTLLTQADAYFIAEAFRNALKTKALKHQGSPKGIVTASIGVAMADSLNDPVDLLLRADQALYAAKSAGRDRVMGQIAEVQAWATSRATGAPLSTFKALLAPGGA